MKKELEVVKWYISFLEEGDDTKHLANLYYDLKREHKIMKRKFRRTKERLESELERMTKKFNETEAQLRK